MAKAAYHHGDLRRELLASAAAAIDESGAAALSMRDLARRAGVSHAAPAHHFGDKAGLLTALAEQGYELLADALTAADDFLEAGVAYVRFAAAHRAHFAVMFRPDLYHADDPGLVAARSRARDALRSGAGTLPVDPDAVREAGLAAWSMAHGFATLWLSGALPDAGDDPGDAARAVLAHLAHGR